MLFFLIGLGICVYGIKQWLTTLHIKITHDQVRYTQTGFKTTTWHENLASYMGALKHTIYRRSGDSGTGVTIYCISLKHAQDEHKNIPLYQCYRDHELDIAWAYYADLLDLPGLEDTPEGVVSHTFGEERRYQTAAPPPTDYYEAQATLPELSGVKLSDSLHGKKLTFYRGRMLAGGLFTIGFGALFGGFPLYIFLTEDPFWALWLFIGIGILITGFGLFLSIILILSYEVLLIERQGLTHYIQYPWGPMWMKSIQREELKDVELKQSIHQQNVYKFTITATTDKQSIIYEALLPQENRVQLKNYLKTYYDLHTEDL